MSETIDQADIEWTPAGAQAVEDAKLIVLWDDTRESNVLKWSLRIAVLVLVVATWVLMVVVAHRLAEVQNDLREHPRVVVEESGDA